MDSTRAYQGSSKSIERLYKEVAGNFEPDMTLLLDVPVETSMARVKARGGWTSKYDLKPAPFHKKLRKSYLALAKKYARRMKVVDASGDADEVAENIEAIIVKRFKFKWNDRKSFWNRET